jgi:hypothetical protein
MKIESQICKIVVGIGMGQQAQGLAVSAGFLSVIVFL